MVRVEVARSPEGRVTRFTVSGHAGFGYKGRDVVCAAVSALTQAAVLGLEEVVGLKPEVYIKRGYLSCSLPEGLGEEASRRAQDVLETMVVGLKSLAVAHPRFVQVKEQASGSG